LIALSPIATAQLIDDSFEGGSNVDDWVLWDAQYTAVVPTGGHPLEHLAFSNVGGLSTCQYVYIEPGGTAPFTHSGDWRTAGVRSVSIDLNVRSGRYGGVVCVFLESDPGTPNDPLDDCQLIYVHDNPSPGGIGWRRYRFGVPSVDTVAPQGWFTAGACASTPIDSAWNTVLADVDRMYFVIDAIPGGACLPTEWSIGVDNISVRADDLGVVYCASGPNSTGAPARIQGFGSTAAADGNLNFEVDSLPVDSFGYFLMSQHTGHMLVGGGQMCLGGAIKRFSHSVQQARQDGTVDFSPDFAALPQGCSFDPGDTWNFQYWHRDIGFTANFSDALSLMFE